MVGFFFILYVIFDLLQALPLIEAHALHDLVDPRIGDTYCTYDLYNMAKAAYFCVQTKPTLRPTMAEVNH